MYVAGRVHRGEAVTASKSTRTDAGSAPVRTGLEILAGAVPPVEVSVHVRLGIAETGHHSQPAQLTSLLDAHRAEIEAWLARNPENPTLLLTDPLAALRTAGV